VKEILIFTGAALGLVIGLIYALVRTSKRSAVSEEEIEQHEEFEKQGEEWDAAGGLGGAATRGMRDTDNG
jgi:hypothetical protein